MKKFSVRNIFRSIDLDCFKNGGTKTTTQNPERRKDLPEHSAKEQLAGNTPSTSQSPLLFHIPARINSLTLRSLIHCLENTTAC